MRRGEEIRQWIFGSTSTIHLRDGNVAQRVQNPFTSDGQVARFGPTILVSILASFLPGQDTTSGGVFFAGICMAVVSVALAIVIPWDRLPTLFQMVPIVFQMLAIVAFRDSHGGSTSGYTPLFMLPLLFVSLHYSRKYICFVIALIGASLLIPLVTLGGPDYPASGYRNAYLWIAISIVIGIQVHLLVSSVAFEAADASSKNQKFEDLLRAITGTSIIGLDSDGNVRIFNEGATRMLGYEPDEVIGKSTLMFHDNAELMICFDHVGVDIGELFRDVELPKDEEWTYISKNAQRIPVELTITAIYTPDGHMDGFIAVASDITDRLRAQQAHRDNEQNLSAIAAFARELEGSGDPRPAIATTALVLSHGIVATIMEPDSAGKLVVTAVAGTDAIGYTVALDGITGASRCYLTQAREFVENMQDGDGSLSEAAKQVGVKATAFEPILVDHEILGVLTVSWSTAMSELSEKVTSVVALLAAEAGVAVKRADLVEQLKAVARTDGLTGVANRRSWDEELPREIARAQRGGPLCVAMIDLDRFKLYNDKFGHQGGDHLLRAATAAWRAQLRESDFFARYGGEEFAVLLPNCTLDKAIEVLDRLRLSTPERETCSIGVACWDGIESGFEIVERVDAALYEGKNTGRNKIVMAQTKVPIG